jgi:hypothetical protein
MDCKKFWTTSSAELLGSVGRFTAALSLVMPVNSLEMM